MTLPLGLHLRVLPRFAGVPLDATRLALSTGLARVNGALFPLNDWRPPTEAEARLLLGDGAVGLPAAAVGPHPSRAVRADTVRASRVVPLRVRGEKSPNELSPPVDAPAHGRAGCISLFALPKHLRAQWWDLAAAAGSADLADGVAAYVGAVSQFLQFKGVDVPTPCACQIVVSRPRPDLAGEPLHPFPLMPPDAELDGPGTAAAGVSDLKLTHGGRLLGAINLADDPSWLLVLACRTPAQMAAAPPGITPFTFPESGVAPDISVAPVLRVEMGPGEGCLLAPDYTAAAFSPRPGQELSMFLCLRNPF